MMNNNMGNWLKGESDAYFDHLFNSEVSHSCSGGDGSTVEIGTDGTGAFRANYVQLVRGWVDSAIVVNVDGSRSVNLCLKHFRGILWTSESLRIIADYLDELNIDWELDLCAYWDDYSFGESFTFDN